MTGEQADRGDLLATIRDAMVERAEEKGRKWASLLLRVDALDQRISTTMSMYRTNGRIPTASRFPAEVKEALRDLRDLDHRAGEGTWWKAWFEVAHTDTGPQIADSYDRETPPFEGAFIHATLAKDLRRYPRDRKYIPDWHPSRASEFRSPDAGVWYTTRWNDWLRQPSGDTRWLDVDEARWRHAAIGVCAVDAAEVWEGHPIAQWVHYGWRALPYTEFFDRVGNMWRRIVWKRIDGRLWRDEVTDYVFPDHATYWDGADIGRITIHLNPDGRGSLNFHSEVDPVISNRDNRIDLSDQVVLDRWLDVPVFGDWSSVTNPALMTAADMITGSGPLTPQYFWALVEELLPRVTSTRPRRTGRGSAVGQHRPPVPPTG